MSKRGDKKKKQILKKREYNRRGRATVILDVPSFDSITGKLYEKRVPVPYTLSRVRTFVKNNGIDNFIKMYKESIKILEYDKIRLTDEQHEYYTPMHVL